MTLEKTVRFCYNDRMKKLYLIGGTMGVGKSSVCETLNKILPNSVYLDGDWCWKANPFVVNEETKAMVLSNICHVLNNFIRCSVYKNIIFCWVMNEQSVIDDIISKLLIRNIQIVNISLTTDKAQLKAQLQRDIERGLRSVDILEKSLSRLSHYDRLNTLKIDTSNRTIEEIAQEISRL